MLYAEREKWYTQHAITMGMHVNATTHALVSHSLKNLKLTNCREIAADT